MSQTKDFLVEQIKERIASFEEGATRSSVGRVIRLGDGIAAITGLSEARMSEMLEIKTSNGSVTAVALNLGEDEVGAIILGDSRFVKEGDEVKPMGRILEVPVGEGVVGRVVNPLGEALDGKGAVVASAHYPVEKIAPGVITRQSVNEPLQTGIKSIDAMVPIGRGQRELIIGDRQVGKTAIAIDAIINQKGKNINCIYVAIGQKESKVASILAKLEEAGAMEYTTIVLAGASDPSPLLYIAPYAGCAMAEYFLDQGKDSLIVYDDLSKHAVAYREIALLLRRPPGREAYPGDVFYLHSRLLERACKLNREHGGGSITALPIIETQAGDSSAYIPTNVISITDGQIYLEPDLFYQGIRPAINAGLSVSRVGSAAQIKAMKKVAGQLRLEAAQYRELAAFSQFGSDLDDETRRKLERGKRLFEVFKQPQYSPVPVAEQTVIFWAATAGELDNVPVEKIVEFEHGLRHYLNLSHGELLAEIEKSGVLSDETVEALKQAVLDYKATVDYLIV